MGISDLEREFIADVTRRFAALGIDASHLTIEYQSDIQDHHVVIADIDMSAAQIEGVMDTVAPVIHVEFANHATFLRYAAEWMRRHPSDGRGVIGGT